MDTNVLIIIICSVSIKKYHKTYQIPRGKEVFIIIIGYSIKDFITKHINYHIDNEIMSPPICVISIQISFPHFTHLLLALVVLLS